MFKKNIVIIIVISIIVVSVNIDYTQKEFDDIESIIQEVKDNNVITRYYSKTDNSQSSLNTVDLLRLLGMSDSFISDLSSEELEFYKQSDSIKSQIQYIRSDGNGKIEYISEDEALKALTNFENQPMAYNTSQDSYMKLTHYLVEGRSDIYKHVTNAEWLIMPAFRGIDSIGSCAQYSAVIPGSERGYYSYNVIDTMYGNSTEKNNISRSRINTAFGMGYNGSAGTFNLPSDYESPNRMKYIRNFRTHFEFKAKISEPDHRINFNSTGSYYHSIKYISFDPSISIDYEGISVSIGINISTGVEKRNTTVLASYTP